MPNNAGLRYQQGYIQPTHTTFGTSRIKVLATLVAMRGLVIRETVPTLNLHLEATSSGLRRSHVQQAQLQQDNVDSNHCLPHMARNQSTQYLKHPTGAQQSTEGMY